MMSDIESGPTFARQRDVFLQALEQPDENARAAFIARATEGDPRLRAIVEKLLAEHRADNFLEEPAANVAGARDKFGGEQPGQMIGRYKLIEVIGEGGCGTVFLAEQREPVRRRVALKLIKLGMDTRSVVARFEAERQALALMDHPSIARVWDGGATSTGRPYFVMELVRGARITEYCEANALTVRERLGLFTQLCYAIQHAHQKGIIHRDLKPSNVLVTMQDGAPVPKVIDFGIAKAIEEPLTEKTLFTNFHAFIGTPAYTSPEQAQMTGADVDTRSDIYSLGVLLYELLAGVTPFDPKELTQSGLDEMRRIIREQEPPRPSVRRTTLEARTAREKPSSLQGLRIDPDLDWIIMKCLEKDRAQRYATAQELANDLQRYLDNEPVRARPPSRAYLVKKSLRKHRRTVAVGAAICVTLIVGATLSIWQAIRATHAEHSAERLRFHEAALRQKAETEREHALANQHRAELNEYIADINLAHQALLAGNFSRGADLLRKHLGAGKTDLRGFEWRYLWNMAKGDEHEEFAKEASSVFGLAISPNGEWLAVGLRDTIKIYDLKSRELKKTLPKSGISLAFSSQGLLANAGPGSVHLWSPPDWSELLALSDHFGPVCFSADGTIVASVTRAGVTIENVHERSESNRLDETRPPLAISNAGKIAANSREGLKIFDLRTGQEIVLLEDSSDLFMSRWVNDKPVLKFSPDGNWIVAARATFGASGFRLELWDTMTGEHVASFPSEREVPEHVGVISAIAFSPDGRSLATASWDHSVRLWNLEERRCVRKFQGTLSEVWSATFAPDGKHIISGAKDGTVTFWPAEEERSETLLSGDWMPLAVSQDSRLLAMLGNDQTLAFFNLKTREIEQRAALPVRAERIRNPFMRAEISQDFSKIAVPSGPGSIRIFDVRGDQPVEMGLPSGVTRGDSVALSPDGSTLVTGEWGEDLAWWKLGENSNVSRKLPGNRAFFAKNGQTIVTTEERGLWVWDAISGSAVTNFPTDSFLGSVALSADGLVLAAGSDPQDVENAIRLWDLRTGKLLGICAGHTQGVGRLAFSPDGKTLASTSTDGTLRFWNVQTQQQLLAVNNRAAFSDLIFSPDGSVLITRTSSGVVALSAPHDDK